MKYTLTLALLLVVLPLVADDKKPAAPKPAVEIPAGALVMVVMDPLAAPLSCPCVEGYAQRDYDKLAAFLSSQLGREVVAVYNASLPAALKMDTKDRADIVIGKHSVVLYDAKKAGKQFRPVLALTGKDGKTIRTEGTLGTGGVPQLTRLGDFELEAELGRHVVVLVMEDRPGGVGAVGSILGRHQINISGVHLGVAAARSMSIWNVDSPLPDELVVELRQTTNAAEALALDLQ